HRLRRIGSDLGHGPLHRLQDRIVTAARAPAHFLIGREIGGGQFGHLVHQPRASSIAASISLIRKGWPETLFSGRASTRYWSRSTVFNWPVFISGTMIFS